MSRDRSGLALGYLAAMTAVTIWASWIIWLRLAVARGYGAPLTPVDVGLFRFGAPMLLLAPVWLRGGLRESFKPARTPWPALLAMLGWGAPFVLLLGVGASLSSVAHVATLVPGVMPLWATLFGMLLFRETVSAERRIGLMLIGVAVALALLPELAAGDLSALRGAPWLLAGSAVWAGFSVAYRHSGLGPVRAVGVVAAWSTLALLALAAVFGSNIPRLTPDVFLWMLLLHGLLSGVASIVTYNFAIGRLGAARAVSLTALVPVLAVLFGALGLGERLSVADIAAILAASLGVALANGAMRPRRAAGP